MFTNKNKKYRTIQTEDKIKLGEKVKVKGALSLESDIRNNQKELLEYIKVELKEELRLRNSVPKGMPLRDIAENRISRLKFSKTVIKSPYKCQSLTDKGLKEVRLIVDSVLKNK